MKTLVLCRHAKSDWPADTQDLDRPLKKRGVKDAHRLGKLLRSHDFDPDLIITSPANRARTTAEIVAEEMGHDRAIQLDRSIYFEGVGKLMEIVSNIPDTHQTVMIFGHNPTLEQAVRYLLKTDMPYAMPTCGMACFEFYITEWQRFTERPAHLRWLLLPRLARKS